MILFSIPGLARLTRHINDSFACTFEAGPLRLEALRPDSPSCYGLRLNPFAAAATPSVSLSIRFVRFCHEHSCAFLIFLVASVIAPVFPLGAQVPAAIPPQAPAPGDTRFFANRTQESRGDWKYLRGGCRILTHEEEVDADEIDFNQVSSVAYLRGHVKYQNFVKGDKVEAVRGEYNLKTQEGTFYQVKGTSPAHGNAELWLLRTNNPFYFEGEWAERHHNRYVIHNGFLTDCVMPKPWWTLHAPIFDVIPDDRAIAHNAVFRLKKVPILFLPAFYRPLGRKDRQSGFLTPNIGNSSVLGTMFGGGYYWAINRSYDALYRIQDFTERGYAHRAEIRGKPTQKSDFDFNLYGVNDRGLPLSGGRLLDEGGAQFELTANTELPDHWDARLDYKYLSSYLFRQSFSQSFTEAIYAENNSVGYLQRHWQDYTVNVGFMQQQLFQSIMDGDRVEIRALPSIDVIGKDKQLLHGPVPLWYSFTTNSSLLVRDDSKYGAVSNPTSPVHSGAVSRENVQPEVMTAFNFKGFSLVPDITFHGTSWSKSLTDTRTVMDAAIFQRAADVRIDLRMPSLERVFPAPKWLGSKIKHVIEPRASYRYIGGIGNFNNLIRFDETEMLSNTNQVEVAIINRFYLKDKTGKVRELADWQVGQDRYFDPTFGGALVPGQANSFAVTEDLVPFAFITRPRNYSPIDSNLQLNGFGAFTADWRLDYDPLYGRIVSDLVDGGYRFKTNYFVRAGYRGLNPDPLIEGYGSQVTVTAGYGGSLRKGLNFATSIYYDYQRGQLEFFFSQLTYNTDCCGFSLEMRRFSFGTRNENQFLFSFVIANIGGFGNLRRQDRIF
jgi:LPS-assembly protein